MINNKFSRKGEEAEVESARDKKCTSDSSSYDGFFSVFFYACALQFYDVFFFYHKA